MCFGADASHGYERTHIDSLRSLAELLAVYMQAPPVTRRDARELGPVEDFPEQPLTPPPGAPVVPKEDPREY